MKACPHCDEEIEDDAIKCSYCAEVVSQPSIRPASEREPSLASTNRRRRPRSLVLAVITVAVLGLGIVPGLRRSIEAEFLRPVYLGESVLPFRVLSPLKGVIPWDGELRDAAAARHAGYLDLAGWMEEAETVWNTHSANRLSLLERWDFHGELRAQFPIPSVRLVYTASGTIPAAALLTDAEGVIEHKLYWAALSTEEARYLEAILNSDITRRLVEPLQSRGQWGPRDFDKYVLETIPAYSVGDPAHAELVKLAEQAENVAAGIQIPAGMRFVRARQFVRQTLQSEGVAGKIEKLVEGVMAPGSE